ncbi:type I glutamate--ammonia ligase [Candidatus Bipolaricaulota bacterium]
MATVESVRELIASEAIEFVDLRVVDLTGRWRHVTVPAERFDASLVSEGVAFDASNLGYASVEGSDMILRPDLGTAAVVAYNGEQILTLICDIHLPETGESFAGDPRAVASKAEAYLEAEKVAESVLMSPEFEFYVFHEASFSSGPCEAGFALEPLNVNAERSFYHACPPEDRLFELRNEICRQLQGRNIEVKYHHHEVGAYGQLEIELGFLGLRSAADATMILKSLTRSIAADFGLTATFLPKPIYGENGSGLHVHQFLAAAGASLFEDKGGLSDLALCYIGGILTHGRSLCALTNPSTNSYRRLVPGYEAPVWLAFGEGNRSAAIRIPRYASPHERRIELRTGDATCNPYFAYAAMLMAGIDGIRRGLNATDLGFGPFGDNLYETSEAARGQLEAAPVDLEDALASLEADHDFLLAGDVFSSGQISNWVRTKRQEARSVRNRPHPYEFPLYFDL